MQGAITFRPPFAHLGVFEALNVVFLKVLSDLHFNQLYRLLPAVFKAMYCAVLYG